MPIIRKKLYASEVYPTNIRYNEDTGTVQSFMNDTWVDNPAADPRNNTLFPPRITSSSQCDGAESVKDAFKRQIDGVLTLISGSQTAFTIAGAILALFEFGPWGVLIVIALAIAHTMLDAGAAAINLALTLTVYHTFACILYCRMDSTGHIDATALSLIEGDITAQIGGLGATILNAMLGLAGVAGVNNLSSIGTSTGDCSDCSCDPCENQASWFAPAPGVTGHLTGNSGPDWVEWASDQYSGDGQWYITGETAGMDTCCKIRLFQIMTEGGAFPGGHEVALCGHTEIVDNIDPADGHEIWIFQVRCNMSMVVRVHFAP
jgi:hypothetical protein